MEASMFLAVKLYPASECHSLSKRACHTFISRSRSRSRPINESTRNRRLTTSISVTEEYFSSIISDSDQVGVSWEVVVGALAGVTPFVVAGIEFSKRIVAQKKCGKCGGSGLVKRENYYFRCPSCGGFLPWQSWKRFFSG